MSGWARRIFCIAIFFAAGLRADVLSTLEGQRFEGRVEITGGELRVRSSDGATVSIGLNRVAAATIDARPPATTRSTTAPTSGPATNGTAVPVPQPMAVAIAPEKKTSPADLRGVLGEFFTVEYTGGGEFPNIAQTRFKERTYARLFGEIFFEFGRPTDSMVTWPFAASFTGFLIPPHTDEYTLAMEVDGAARVWIDDAMLIDIARKGWERAKIKLEAGRWYRLRVEHTPTPWWGRCKLYWSSSQFTERPVPAEALRPPGEVPNLPPYIGWGDTPPNPVVVAPRPLTIDASARDPDGRVARLICDLHTLPDSWEWRHVIESDDPSAAMVWKDPPMGYPELRLRAVDDRGLVGESSRRRFTVTSDRGGTIPLPWTEMLIGRTVEGKTTSAGKTLSESAQARVRVDGGQASIQLAHRGADFWAEGGEYQVIVQKLDGDGQIVAKLARFDVNGGEAASIAGAIFRTALDPGSDSFVVAASGDGFGEVIRAGRSGTGIDATAGEGAPRWLKLTRAGERIGAYVSDDGKTWQARGRWRVEKLPQMLWAGVMLAGRSEARDVEAMFESVRVSAGSPRVVAEPGVLLRNGSFLAGQIVSANPERFSIRRGGKTVEIPMHQAARLIFCEIQTSQFETIPSAEQGGLLTGAGDFLQGELMGLRDGSVEIRSVIFGTQRFKVGDGALAFLARDPAPHRGGLETELEDGSILRGAKLVGSDIVLEIKNGADLVFSGGEARRFTRE